MVFAYDRCDRIPTPSINSFSRYQSKKHLQSANDSGPCNTSKCTPRSFTQFHKRLEAFGCDPISIYDLKPEKKVFRKYNKKRGMRRRKRKFRSMKQDANDLIEILLAFFLRAMQRRRSGWWLVQLVSNFIINVLAPSSHIPATARVNFPRH